jgi:GntR family transcriptional regulator
VTSGSDIMGEEAGERLILRDDPLPYYEQLKRLLIDQLQRGILKAGDMLPSEGQLCQTYGVSRTVVRQAIGELVNDGLLQRMRGRGTIVIGSGPRPQFLESSVSYVEQALRLFPTQEFSAKFTDVSAETAGALKLTGDTACIEVARTHSDQGQTVAKSLSWIASSDSNLLRALQRISPDQDSVYAVLERHFGTRLERGHREIYAVEANSEIAGQFGLAVGAPVLFARSLVVRRDNTPIERSEVWCRPDAIHFDAEIVRSRRWSGAVGDDD